MEIWDLYDSARNKLERKILRGEEIPENCYYLSVHLCIFNSDGKMLIQKRTRSKSAYPGVWDLSAGGGAQSGDDSPTAIAREAKEELGIEIDPVGLRPALTIHFGKGFDDLYLMQADLDPSSLALQKEEVDEVRWAAESEIIAMIEDGSFVPYHRSLIELCFDMHRTKDAINR